MYFILLIIDLKVTSSATERVEAVSYIKVFIHTIVIPVEINRNICFYIFNEYEFRAICSLQFQNHSNLSAFYF